MRGLSTNERIIVSALRSAGRITIETTTEDGCIIRVAVTGRKPVHDIAIAIAVQDFYNNFSHD